MSIRYLWVFHRCTLGHSISSRTTTPHLRFATLRSPSPRRLQPSLCSPIRFYPTITTCLLPRKDLDEVFQMFLMKRFENASKPYLCAFCTGRSRRSCGCPGTPPRCFEWTLAPQDLRCWPNILLKNRKRSRFNLTTKWGSDLVKAVDKLWCWRATICKTRITHPMGS